MYIAFDYTLCFWCLVITVQGIYTTTVSDDSRTIQNILKQRSWYWNGDSFKGIFDQQVFIDGRLNKFINVVGIPSRVHKTNIHTVSSVMYLALGCKCGETMIDVLKLLALWMDNGQNHGLVFLRPYLEDINKAVLKTVSILFHFLDIAPSAVSNEPGVLITFLYLNLHLNDLIENHSTKPTKIIGVSPQIIQKLKNVIFQLINSIERVTVSDCSSKIAEFESNNNSYIAYYDSVGDGDKIDRLLHYFNYLLDNTGLSTLNLYKFNLNVDLFDETPSVEDNLNSNVVGYVLDRFSSILKCQQNIFESDYEDSFIDIEVMFSCQKLMYDLILLIIHKNVWVYLKISESLNKNESSSTFFPNLNLKDENIIKSYQELLFQVKLKNFPSEIVNQIRLIYRVLRSVFVDRPIHDLDLLIIKQEIDIRSLKYNPILHDDSKVEIIENHILSKENNFTLHTFLEEIVSVEFIKYFNSIFKLLQNDFEDSNSRAIADLRNIRYETNVSTYAWKCSGVVTVYAHCYEIQSAINNNLPKTSSRDLKKKLLTVLNILSGIIEYEQSNSQIVSYNLVYAYLYLSYNYINYTRIEYFQQEILTRMLYTLTNLIDRHQAWICKNPRDRYSLYGAFERDSDFLRKELDLKKHKMARYIVGENSSVFNVTAAQSNMDNFVLMENFVRKLHSVQPDLKLFWKGELKTIIDALEDTKRNLFNFSIISKHVKLVVEWTTAVFSYTILDVIDYMLMKKCSKHDSKTNNYRFRFHNCQSNLLCTLNLVINKMSYLSRYYGEFEDVRFGMINGIKIMLENEVAKFKRFIKPNSSLQEKPSLDVKHSKTVSNLNAMFEILTNIQKQPTFLVNFNDHTIPLTYVLTDYIDIQSY